MRGTYGPDQPYTEMAARALKLWAKYEKRWNTQFLHRTGVLWMASGNEDSFERGSVKAMRAAKIKFQELSTSQMQKRWPQINFDGIEWGIFEPECGYLEARASCQAVVEAFQAAGGTYRRLAVVPEGLETGLVRTSPCCRLASPCWAPWKSGPSGPRKPREIRAGFSPGGCSFGRLPFPQPLKADLYVFACGPWLGQLFPQAVGNLVQATKQDIFFFGTPAGDDRFSDAHLPVWADHRGRFRYGIPGSDHRGFKIADDTRGPAFDPTDGERVVSPDTLKDIREYVAFRFPALKDAPLIETRVCQYEQTPDAHFLIDRHPDMENVWLLGGGSGHGFKHGPAIGEMMAELILKDREPRPIWRLGRFKKP